MTLWLQQQVSRLLVEQLVAANEMLKEVLELNPWVTFNAPEVNNIKDVRVCTFSDASFNRSSSSGYGQTGLMTGLRIELLNGADPYHAIDWCSTKQIRVSYSTYGAEVLPCADADDRGFYYKYAFNSMFPRTKVESELFTDLRCLYDTIITLHEGPDFTLRPTVLRIRNSFDSQELDSMRWIPGSKNPADALTKRTPETTKLLDELVSTGIMCLD